MYNQDVLIFEREAEGGQMEDRDMFKVGDRVSLNRTVYFGTVVSVSPKRRDVTVDFGHFKAVYDSDGWRKGQRSWDTEYIVPVTEELRKKLADEAAVSKCKRLMHEMQSKITADQARRIIAILEEKAPEQK